MKHEKSERRVWNFRAANKNRVVILVDDGIATGATTMCAIKEILSQMPEKIVLATPVSSLNSVEKLSKLVDEMVVLESPVDFRAVGQFFEDFSQVEEPEVKKILRRAKDKKAA